jgi:electron transfer flavoprotein alpha subunit
MTVLCLIEHDDSTLADASLRALTLARDLATSAGGQVAAVVFTAAGDAAATPACDAPAGDDAAPGDDARGDGQASGVRRLPAALAAAGVDTAWAVQAGTGYAPVTWARALADLAVSCAAGAVVAAATDRGSEVLAHLGAITGQPVAAQCVSARFVSPGLSELTRQRWAGSVLEDATLEAPLALLTVAADAVPARPAAPAATIDIREFRPDPAPGSTADPMVVRAVESDPVGGGVSLATARVVVGGGRGVGGPDGFTILEELAALLGGTVGVSRVVTSQGWRPHSQQVGQTGTKITPDLYLACGISGAIQHMAGCQAAKHLIAVNTDPDAPIIARADYAIIGDLSEVLPALITAINTRPPTP